MRFFKLLIAVLLVSLGLTSARLRAQTLRVMTFNVRTGIANDGPNDWNHRRDIMVRTIREQHPDVLGTQELNKFQGDYIVSKLPQYVWFGIGRRGDDGDEHMGVFYRSDRLRVIDSGNYWLSDTPDKPGSITCGNPYPRMVTWALFERKADDRHFYYCNTHFPYRDQDELARTRSAQEILSRLNALPTDLPIVMTGDFNSAPDKPDHAVLTSLLDDAWISAGSHGGPEKTFHNFTGIPDRRIDWILYRDFRALTAQTVTTQQDDRYPSDHFPVVAVLAWPARQKVRVSEKPASTSLPATP
ncbi:endonuclease/exonuclease/phosphatase family protein [Rhodanobacter sp. A1T4]|uniref:endonuclease/exonuclease/phosphatase family protein n=1 Tax=Rhodanobacter sp. A1T4 TaxID=2723087 RepID=UPI0016205691|nr:endonuclease/exonuclease/phosphatase family protein [Rhodanobacter sp. A1T4]MBB6245040.1 endonuclease/exonuclease/phosphatase family metal-dependent hydrolase [Rhodanobacter sp. A1T4]